ncbi:uncharacterized protein LOC102807562 [Saccoglossus kowalevskii]|uniref:Uncharacterized protein LOC102807562 n=1 Tax=Saccoglossus kowalevskii TaxID=10224 RepID=A0ABM0M556_SACKO|nr:PREDICTED: uncharacterized protein LOC102807562 [Saccoglossus kowalevskii]
MDAHQIIFIAMVTFLSIAGCYGRPSGSVDDVLTGCKRKLLLVDQICAGCYAPPDIINNVNFDLTGKGPGYEEEIVKNQIKEACCKEYCPLPKIIEFCCDERQQEFHQFMSSFASTEE